MSNHSFLIFPHQLFKDITLLNKFNKVYIIEDPIFFFSTDRPLNFNKLKLLLHRASMNYYYDLFFILKDNS
jgi:deoxyribodipyrimidine photolyase-related protein